MSKEEHYRKLERMYLSAPVNAYYAPSIRVSEGRGSGTFMPSRIPLTPEVGYE